MTKDLNDQLMAGALPPDPLEGAVPMTDDPEDESTTQEVSNEPLKTSIEALFDDLDFQADGKRGPVPTPWGTINSIINGGFRPGLHMLTGGTGAGKTQFALSVALHAAQNGHHVAYVSLEMSREQIAARFIGELLGVRWSDIVLSKSYISRDELEKAGEELKGLPITVQFAPPMGWTPNNLLTLAGSFGTEKTPLVIVDFLQLVGGNGEVRDRIREASYFMREVARKHHAAVLAISSVARTHYPLVSGLDINGKTPYTGIHTARDKNDLTTHRYLAAPDLLVGLGKESGEIEFSADSVLTFMKCRTDAGELVIRVTVPKLRAGAPSWAPLTFEGGRFKETQGTLDKKCGGPMLSDKQADDVRDGVKPLTGGESNNGSEIDW